MAGLSRKHHGELNSMGVAPARYNELRQQYAGDSKAQQQIDVYDPSTEYYVKFRAYGDALKFGDSKKAAELKAWFDENYPDI